MLIYDFVQVAQFPDVVCRRLVDRESAVPRAAAAETLAAAVLAVGQPRSRVDGIALPIACSSQAGGILATLEGDLTAARLTPVTTHLSLAGTYRSVSPGSRTDPDGTRRAIELSLRGFLVCLAAKLEGHTTSEDRPVLG